ncbi:MAG: AraC family transcriptional regulator [Spirochaetes bacterium]|nr:AraC family transcriptional regulator [Spirochaetota bacterium]
MVRDIFTLYYLPVAIFVSHICCIIVIAVIYSIKKFNILLPVFLHSVVLAIISLKFVYPIYMYIDTRHYFYPVIFILIALYGLVTLSITNNNFKSSLYNFIGSIIGKSVIVTSAIVIIADYKYEYSTIMITSADMILSTGVVLSTRNQFTQYPVQWPYKELFMLMILLTIIFCIITTFLLQIVHILLYFFAILSASYIVLLTKFLIALGNDTNGEYICSEEYFYNTGRYDSIIKIIKEHVNEHYTLPIDKYTIALQCEMHPDYISKVFKSEEGITINKYIQIVRMEKAYKLVMDTDKKIIEVAFNVGYENLATFYRHFMRHHKKSPHRLRKEKSIP